MPCEMGNHGMQYIYQADKINGEISKPYKDVYYMNCRGSRRLIIGVGADIHIFVFTDCKKQSISKEINDAEQKYMNISPPPPQLSIFCSPRGIVVNGHKLL